MKKVEKLKEIAAANGGIIETKKAAQNGITRSVLSTLYKQNKISRISKGQYIFPDDELDEFLSISKRSDKIILSHETALYLHGISDRTPHEISITAPADCAPSPSIVDECKIYYVNPELFTLGKTMLITPSGNKVLSYDLERTICDIVRSRSKIDIETFLTAMKMYAASPKKDLHKLDEYAKKLRVLNVLRTYVEVLL